MNQLHIITVGISALTNFEKATGVARGKALRRAKAVAEFLAKNPAGVSAELNALNARTGLLAQSRPGLAVTLVYTETNEGKLCAGAIRKFLAGRGLEVSELKLKHIELPAEKAADPGKMREFAESGLRGLRVKVEDHVNKMRKQFPDLEVEFNVTGGYKAEVAVLYGLGLRMNIPVYYLHETYGTAIVLP